MRYLFLLISAALALTGADAAASGACNAYSWRSNPKLDLTAVSRLVAEPLVDASQSTTPSEARLVVLPFDREDQPTFGSWRGVAVVWVTRGDLGERTVGGLLLQRSTDSSVALHTAQVVKNGTEVQLRLRESVACPPYVVGLQDDGTLTVQGVVVGVLR